MERKRERKIEKEERGRENERGSGRLKVEVCKVLVLQKISCVGKGILESNKVSQSGYSD